MLFADISLEEHQYYTDVLYWLKGCSNIELTDEQKAKIDELLAKNRFFWTEDDETFAYEWTQDSAVMRQYDYDMYGIDYIDVNGHLEPILTR